MGELAKKMGTTVRTLQYYHREGLLAPSLESEGGRRLYTDRDMVKLHQILSLKSLGFSLDDIKNHLVSLDTPADVAAALAEQAAVLREELGRLRESLAELEALRAEVLQMQTVDFKKYADIIVNLQMKNKFYRLIKHFDDETLDFVRSRFDRNSGPAMLETVTRVLDEAVRLESEGVAPESGEGQALAKLFWEMILEFTGGNLSLLPKLAEVANSPGPAGEWLGNQTALKTFVEPALEAYFAASGHQPFEEEKK